MSGTGTMQEGFEAVLRMLSVIISDDAVVLAALATIVDDRARSENLRELAENRKDIVVNLMEILEG